jgi:hypothetical protein
MQTSRYTYFLNHSTTHHKLASVSTTSLVRQLEHAILGSVYQLYTLIYHSQELNSLTASKAHPTETLRNHLIGVANWVLFWLRTRPATSVALAGKPGGTPGPVEMEDPWGERNHSLRGESPAI